MSIISATILDDYPGPGTIEARAYGSPLALPGTVAFRLVDAFLSDKSPNTRRGYAQDLESFRAFYGHESIEGAAQTFIMLKNGSANAVLLNWKAAQLEQKLTPATINRRLACLRSLVKRARQLGLTTLCIDVEGLRRQPYRDTRGPGVTNAAKMLSIVGNRPGARGARDAAMLSLAIECGLRRFEILGLDLEHVELDLSSMWILGKGRQQRERVTLPEATVKALELWISARGNHPGPLFVGIGRSGELGITRLTGSGLYGLVRRCGRKLGLTVSPHRLRHTAITAGLDASNGDVRSCRLFSRHADLGTLTMYDDARGDKGGSIAKLVSAAVRHEVACLAV
jgi:integrase/recombinase XerC